MSSPTTILGIDPGIADMGWGIVEQTKNGELLAKYYGSIKTSPHNDLPTRLGQIYVRLNQIILDYTPDQVGIEKLFFGKNSKTAMSVGEARGVAMLIINQNQLPFVEITPAEIKQALTGYGSADKQQMQRMVKSILGLSEIPKPDDAADALAVAIATLAGNSMREHVTKL